MKCAAVLLLLAIAFGVYAEDKAFFVSYDVKSWKLELSSSVGIEHSIVGRLSRVRNNSDFENEIKIYSGCDRRRIVLGQLENSPGLDKRSVKAGNTLVQLLMGAGEYDLKYLGMAQGSQAFNLPDSIWKGLKSSKWAKLSYIGEDEAPVEIRFDMTHLPLLMATVDAACD